MQELARRVGLEGEMAGSIDDYKQRLLAKLAPHGIDLVRLREGPVRNPLTGAQRFPGRRVETPSGKVSLLAEIPAAPPADPRPLWLFSNSTEKSQASQWAGKGLGEHTWVCVHPAAVPGRAAGEIVTVESAIGRVRAELRLDPELRTDVVVMPKGGHYDAGHCANALIEARPTDQGLGAAYLDCRVSIR
jgi:anaerobic selenocysteine-containing dehydrogenase